MNAVVTLAIGEKSREMLDIAQPFFQSYSRKCDAEFIVINEARICEGSNIFEKLQLYDLFTTYERILYFDTDVLISPKCRSLFEIVPDSMVGVYYPLKEDPDDCKIHDHKLMREIDYIQEKLGDVGWSTAYPFFNAGIILCSRRHKELFGSSDKITRGLKFVDQTWLNYHAQTLRLPLFNIGREYNHCLAVNASQAMYAARFESSIMHYAGYERFFPGRSVIELMRSDASRLLDSFRSS